MTNWKEDGLETARCRYGTMSFFRNDTIISRSLKEYGEWAQEEIDFLASLIDPSDTVLDIGAFIGTHSLAFAQKVDAGGKVYAFEPQPAFFKVLQANIEQNGLTNVTALNVAVSDSIGRVEIETDPREDHNLGEAPLLKAQAIAGDSALRHRIDVTTVDELALTRCDLIKIDVESMEIDVLKGARTTLRSLRPIVFAECNSLRYGWPIVELIKEVGYCTYVLSVRAYNPDNYRRNECNNFLGDGREVGFLLVPEEKLSAALNAMDPAGRSSLVPITCIDDLALALLNKPQYKYEVMSKGEAARVLGVEFWANEIEVKQFRTTIEDHEANLAQNAAEISRLTSESADRDAQIASLQGVVADRDAQIASLQEVVTGRDAQIASLQEVVADRDAQIGAILRSHSWRVTGSLRAARRMALELGRKVDSVLDRLRHPSPAAARVSPVSALPPVPDNLLYSIDSLEIRRRRVYGFGWVFDKNEPVVGVKLLVRSGQKEHAITAIYGTSREDVAKAHGRADAEACGFWVAGRLPFDDPSECFLQVETEKGKRRLLPVRLAIALVGIRITRIRILSVARALMHGKFRRLREKIREERSRSRSQVNFEELVLQLGDSVGSGGRSSPGNADSEALASIKEFLRQAGGGTASPQLLLIIDHNLGGGANQYRRRLISENLERGRPVLLLYYHLPRLDYMVECISGKDRLLYRLGSPASLLPLAARLGIKEIFVNNVYSFEDPAALANLLPSLKQASGAKLTIAMHDYLPICPSYTLLDDTGRFCGIPDVSRCQQCLPAHEGEFSHLIDQRDIREWRGVWGRCLSESDTILCFSERSAQLLRRAFPKLDPVKFVIRPHQASHRFNRKPFIDSDGDLNIGVVGGITLQKGACLIAELARYIEEQRLPARITVIGTVIPKPQSQVVTVTGFYEPNDLPDVIEKNHVNMFLFASIWPETFSYVCEELMQLEVPLAVYDIGAPPERVARYRRGLILHEMDVQETMKRLTIFHLKLREEQHDLARAGTARGI